MPPSSTGDAVKKRICQVYSPLATKVHTTTEIHSQHQAADETLQECIQIFTDLVIHTRGADPTSVTCQVTFILFIHENLPIRK